MIRKYYLLTLSVFAVLLLNGFTSNAQTADFTFNPHSGCDNFSVQFTNTSTGATSWVWKENGVQFSTIPSPTRIFNTPGTYVIRLEINGNVSYKVDTVHVYQSPTASFSTVSDTTCVGVFTNFTSTSTAGSGPITSYIWTWGDGGGDTVFTASTSHLYGNAGTFSSNLVIYDSHGCHSQSVPHTIHVLPAPDVHFTMDTTYGCTFPNTVVFTNTSNPAATSYTWDFGDPASGANNTATTPSATHLYNSAGTYLVTLVGNTGSCSDSYALNYNLLPETASVYVVNDTICFGDNIQFFNTSTPAATSSSWNFGDPGSGANNFSNLTNPYHIFSATGLFTVTLNSFDSYCGDVKTINIFVRPRPVASFTNTDSTHCSPPWPVQFSGSGSNIASWNWLYGDGSTGTGQNPTHIYNAYGIDTVTLIVTDIYGCKDTIIHPNDVQIVAPTIHIITLPDSGCNPRTVFLEAAITLGPGDSMDSIVWNFGDGSPSVTGTDTISHTFTYTPPGIYTVTVTMYTSDGCMVTESIAGLIKVGNHLSLTFDHYPDTVCFGDSIHFWSTVPQADPPITSYNWNFGGRDSSCWMYTAQFDTGWYVVNLICYCNGCGSGFNYFDSVFIMGPKPDFTVTYDCVNRYTVTLQDASHDADSIVWNWGDLSPPDGSNNSTPTHTYASRGDYYVTQTAYNYLHGCDYTDTLLVQIRDAQAMPLAFPATGCFPITPFFSGSTSQDALLYAWNFNDPASGTLNTSPWPDTVHLFNAAGVYNVRLIVTDLHGCVDTAYVPINANGPHALFSTLDSVGCMPFTTTFDAGTSTDFGGNLTSYTWNFNYPTGSSNTTALDTIPWTYTNSGQYTIQLILTDNNGCHDTVYHSSYIRVMHPYPSLPIDTFLCSNSLANFTGLITDIPGSGLYSYAWDFGDATSGITNANVVDTFNTVSHTYTVNGSTNVLTLIVTDVEGCTDTIRQNITVLDPVAAFTVTATDSCGYTHVQFNSPNTTNNYAWQWSITGPAGYSSSSVLQSPYFNFTVPGTYNTTLTVTNPGCTATVPVTGVVVDHPVAHFDYTPDTHCPPVPIPFTTHLDSQTPYIYIQWVFGDGNTAYTYYPDSTYTYTYYTPGTYMPQALISYVLSNGDTCLYEDTNTVNQPIIITSEVTTHIDQSPQCFTVIKEGDIDTLYSTSSGSNPPLSYSWTAFPGSTTLPAYNTTGAIYTADDTLSTSVNCADGTTQNSVNSYVILTVTDSHGCKALDTVYYDIKPCNRDILIPNVFTPNGDHLNDTYYIGKKDADCNITDFKIKIFNRWGNVVYEASLPAGFDFAWDGKDDNGKDCSEGTYYYAMSYVVRNKAAKDHGYIQLIRE